MGPAVERRRHAESLQIQGNNNHTSVLIDTYNRLQTSNRLMSFTGEKVTQAETQRLGLLVLLVTTLFAGVGSEWLKSRCQTL